MANEVIGGSFTARLNMNLREDKHWSYGARSMLADAEGQRPWLAYAPVQIDKTAESLAAMQREISSYVDGEAPATDAEVEKTVANNLRSQPGATKPPGPYPATSPATSASTATATRSDSATPPPPHITTEHATEPHTEP